MSNVQVSDELNSDLMGLIFLKALVVVVFIWDLTMKNRDLTNDYEEMEV